MLESSLILEGDTILMECEVYGYPNPLVQWFKDGELVVNKSTLKLNNIQRQQGGVFVCSACNRVGKEMSTSLVKVHCEYFLFIFLLSHFFLPVYFVFTYKNTLHYSFFFLCLNF